MSTVPLTAPLTVLPTPIRPVDVWSPSRSFIIPKTMPNPHVELESLLTQCISSIHSQSTHCAVLLLCVMQDNDAVMIVERRIKAFRASRHFHSCTPFHVFAGMHVVLMMMCCVVCQASLSPSVLINSILTPFPVIPSFTSFAIWCHACLKVCTSILHPPTDSTPCSPSLLATFATIIRVISDALTITLPSAAFTNIPPPSVDFTPVLNAFASHPAHFDTLLPAMQSRVTVLLASLLCGELIVTTQLSVYVVRNRVSYFHSQVS